MPGNLQCLEETESYYFKINQGQDKVPKTLLDSWSPPLPIGRQRLAPNTQIPDDEIYARKQERNRENVSENITAHERFQPAEPKR